MTSSSSAFICGQMASKGNNFKNSFFGFLNVLDRNTHWRLYGPFRAIISNARKMESVQWLGQAISVNDNMQKSNAICDKHCMRYKTNY